MNVVKEEHEKPKVLLFAPISHHKNYVIKDWLNFVMFKLRYDQARLTVLLIVNNSPDEFESEIIEFVAECGAYNTPIIRNIGATKTSREGISKSQEFARKYAMDEKFDYMFSLECDVFPAENTIDRLLAHKKPVVGFTYFIYLGKDTQLCLQQCKTRVLHLDHLVVKNTVVHPFDCFLLMNGQLRRVHGIGMGCVMIAKEVFEKIPFRHDDNDMGVLAHSDTYFAQDLFLKDIPLYCDTSHICEHRNQDWNKLNIVV